MDIIHEYVTKFNAEDKEYYKQDINNNCAEKWIKENVPYFECPDKEVEEIYYFRWWVNRKHIKYTEDGYIITEFLPDVPWAGKHNAIVAAVGHHIAEFKWLKNGKRLLYDYIKFWLDEIGDIYAYSTWIIYATYELCLFEDDFSFAKENLDSMIRYYEKMSEMHKCKSGLFWSIDDRDAMEYSISGTNTDGKAVRGIRPTLNSYMAANAFAISEIAKIAGKEEIYSKFRDEYQRVRELINKVLWDNGFYKAIHYEGIEESEVVDVSNDIPCDQNVKELIGYIPWCFNLPPEEYLIAFEELVNKNCFNSKYGLTSADQRHKRFLFESSHECMWNGYIWPFAVSQTFNAMINLINVY